MNGYRGEQHLITQSRTSRHQGGEGTVCPPAESCSSEEDDSLYFHFSFHSGKVSLFNRAEQKKAAEATRLSLGEATEGAAASPGVNGRRGPPTDRGVKPTTCRSLWRFERRLSPRLRVRGERPQPQDGRGSGPSLQVGAPQARGDKGCLLFGRVSVSVSASDQSFL